MKRKNLKRKKSEKQRTKSKKSKKSRKSEKKQKKEKNRLEFCFALFCFEAKITKVKRSEKFEAKRSEKIEVKLYSEQAKRIQFRLISLICEKTF